MKKVNLSGIQADFLRHPFVIMLSAIFIIYMGYTFGSALYEMLH